MCDRLLTKTFEYKLRNPSKKFVAACEAALDSARLVYNSALEQRITRYKQGKPTSYLEQSRELTEARKLPEFNACLRKIQQDALKRLDIAYQAFFRRVKSGEKPGFPRFKARDRFHTFSQQVDQRRNCHLKGDTLKVPGIGLCRVRLSRPLVGAVKQLKITRRADGWYALLVCEYLKPEPLPITGSTVGIDVGTINFATLSTGEVISNPKHLSKSARKLAKRQRALAKKKRGSANRKKARQKVALTHLHVARSRKDFHHKEVKKLVDRFDAISVEDLNICKMVLDSYYAKSNLDAGWGQFFEILRVKAENAGREFQKIPAAYTSQTCSHCGHRQKMPISHRTYVCAACGITIDRDHNAAINIHRAGQALYACEVPRGTLKQEQTLV